MIISFNKNTVFSALLALIAALIAIRIMPVSVDDNVKLVISKNRVSATNIYQARDIERTKTVMVDKLNLIVENRFKHPELGNIADANDDFFVDIDHAITIKKSGDYRFLVGTDDGFSLKIDGALICEHLGDRPYTIQTCNINLSEGKHQFQLSYFQGYGNSGLTVEYARGDGTQHWFGEDSSDIDFD